jgi:hypothetical protein
MHVSGIAQKEVDWDTFNPLRSVLDIDLYYFV